MSMRPCDNCLDNAWDFEKLPDGYMRATCKMCGYEVEWRRQIVQRNLAFGATQVKPLQEIYTNRKS